MPVSIEELTDYLDPIEVKGWVALHPKDRSLLSGFRTSRLAKVVDGSQFQFSIGATKLGSMKNLNSTIRNIISNEKVEAKPGYSTDGSRQPKKEYPGFCLTSLGKAQFERILFQVMGAICQIKSEVGT